MPFDLLFPAASCWTPDNKLGITVNSAKLRPWETVSKETILDHGKFLKVENHVVKLPDGRIIPDWPWLIIPSAAIVLPVTEDGKFLCFRQTKYAVEGTSLATVGGMLEPNETPLDAAKRELREEMGYESIDWVNLGSHILDPNRGIATMHLFLALDVKKAVEQPASDDLEDQQLVVLSRNEIEQALRAGEFKVLAWSAVVAMSLNYLYMSERSS
jgi:8-oxo-dGTP pyrophosphatase MutT (NUDIX family)